MSGPIAIAVLAALWAAAPAQAAPRERLVEAFGSDPCPQSSGDEIVVCARRPESDRYRIPVELREPAAADLVTATDRVHEMIDIGRTGTDSCSPVGPGGFTGCFLKAVRHGRDEKRAVRRARQAEPD
ncbi:MAG TPA: hypothetical protein VEZ48_03660 [Sphingomonadaceae bacterium]|nr:hypothetical protein [Sphingomonadaceae bacterium]